ncbi:MAG TPA: hypothetical protein VJN43_19015 [Bryobacteraceae bacterium]|nr:hypothetical protein [Bryobacteraceae bacterium]
MAQSAIRLVYWAPRALGIALVIFLSLFALDVFDEGLGFRQTLAALGMHLIPSGVLVITLVLAWRWEWIGAAVFGAAGTLYTIWAWRHPNWVMLIGGPLFVVAALFIMSWINRAQFRAVTHH